MTQSPFILILSPFCTIGVRLGLYLNGRSAHHTIRGEYGRETAVFCYTFPMKKLGVNISFSPKVAIYPAQMQDKTPFFTISRIFCRYYI